MFLRVCLCVCAMCEHGSPGLGALLLDLDNTLVDTRGSDAAACLKRGRKH